MDKELREKMIAYRERPIRNSPEEKNMYIAIEIRETKGNSEYEKNQLKYLLSK